MRIAIIAHGLRSGGGYVVGVNFIRSLIKVAPDDVFFITIPAGFGYESIPLPSNSEVLPYSNFDSLLKRYWFDRLELPKRIAAFKADVIFSMLNYGFTNPPAPQAILLLDAHFVYGRKHCGRGYITSMLTWHDQKAFLKKWVVKCILRKSSRYADIVFCQTPVTKKRFADVFNYPEDKIRIMPSAVSEDLVTVVDEQIRVPQIFKQGKYFNMFYLTKYYTHKNLEILIKIFQRFPEKLKDVRCIITALPAQDRNTCTFFDKVKKHKLENQIVSVGFIKQEELAWYFINSDAIFFPTLMESFSSTYLEAMYFKTPILTSDLDFARYICGEAAIYFDPWNPEDVVNKIVLLKNNGKLKEELVSKGREHVCHFFISWEKIVADVMKELKMLVDNR